MKHHFTYKILFAAFLLSVVFVFAACESKTQTTTADTTTPEETKQDEKVFTLKELSQFDGKDGRLAYVAVDGVVYDVSEKPLWAGGEHQSKVSAGRDLSEAILTSPHGKSKLKDLPIVGKLAEE